MPRSPGEWAVLGAVAEAPTHGFALARLLGPQGALGQVWTLRRPVVYQALKKLTDEGLVTPRATEASSLGPNRTIVAVTPAGQQAVDLWLTTPVRHVRDMRSELLLKLALLDRSGAAITPLLDAQRDALRPRLEALQARHREAVGFERVLAAWRLASVGAALEFLAAARQ
jgi:PadR family transcriptional regulator AphA